MNLKKNTWHYKLWEFNFSEGYKKSTNNFCDYFWAVILSIVLFPITLPAFIFMKIEKNNTSFSIVVNIIVSLVCYIILFLFLCISYQLIKLDLGTWVVRLTLFLLLLVNYLLKNNKIKLKSEKTDKLIDNISDSYDFFKEGFLSFKNKYCPKINWED